MTSLMIIILVGAIGIIVITVVRFIAYKISIGETFSNMNVMNTAGDTNCASIHAIINSQIKRPV
jgi:hypothetical protein